MSQVIKLKDLEKNQTAEACGLIFHKFNNTEFMILLKGHPVKRGKLQPGIEDFDATIVGDDKLKTALDESNNANDWFALLNAEVIKNKLNQKTTV